MPYQPGLMNPSLEIHLLPGVGTAPFGSDAWVPLSWSLGPTDPAPTHNRPVGKEAPPGIAGVR
jgi:hypothetical protein